MASGPECALRQRSTHGCWVSMRRIPQWTTSWSSTTRTLNRSGLRSDASEVNRHHQPDLPGPGLALAELDHATALERLECGQPQAHAGAVPGAGDPVVGHLDHERADVATDADADLVRVRVLVGVAHRLGEDRLSERLEL